MKQIVGISVILSLLLLPGCGGALVDYAKQTFPQGNEYKNQKALIKDYFRSINIYDQFDTLALFGALWLSDEIRTLYSDIYADMLGKDPEARDTYLRRQLKANDHFVSFYVLSNNKVSLSERPFPWALYLEIDGKKYSPSEVKSVELSVEYKMLLGKRLNQHKQAYEVKFDRNDPTGNDILSSGTAHTMKFFFSGPSRYAFAQWDIDQEGKVRLKKNKKQSPITSPKAVSKKNKKSVKIVSSGDVSDKKNRWNRS